MIDFFIDYFDNVFFNFLLLIVWFFVFFSRLDKGFFIVVYFFIYLVRVNYVFSNIWERIEMYDRFCFYVDYNIFFEKIN